MIYNFDNKIFLREEKNGLTMYNSLTHSFHFYKDLTISILNNSSGNTFSEDKLNLFLSEYESQKNYDIEFTRPFALCWFIENNCNLDCVYCFADDKMNLKYDKSKYMDTINSIIEIEPLVISLTGGEPTLSPFLNKILHAINGKARIVLDTNGSTNNWDALIPILYESNTLVRISIDSFSNQTLSLVRPMRNNNIEQIELIKKSIKKLLNENISLSVHTVVSQYNINEIESIANYLLDIGITRWHWFGVNYSEKCKIIYDKIKVNDDILCEKYLYLKDKLINKIQLTYTPILYHLGAKERLQVNASGDFFVDSIINGINFIGENPKKPTIGEICKELNVERHIDHYLKLNQ